MMFLPMSKHQFKAFRVFSINLNAQHVNGMTPFDLSVHRYSSVLCFKGVILQVLCSLTYQNLSSLMLMMQFTSILPDPGKYAKD